MKCYYCLVISYQLGNGWLVQTTMGQSQVASSLFTDSLIQFIYSFYKNYLPGSDPGTGETKQGAKQGSLSTFPSLQVRVAWLLMLDSGLQRALWRNLSDFQDLAKTGQNHFLQSGYNMREDYIRDVIAKRCCGSLYFLIF